MIQLPIKMPPLPSYRETVDAAAAAENLQAVASSNNDPEVWLGLAYLAKAGDAVRRELASRAAEIRNEYRPIIAVLTLVMDRIDGESVGELVRCDPENALGHYLQGTLLHIANQQEDALAAFRKAAACSEVRLYDSITGHALFKGLDALGLQGSERLCALSWTASRSTNFSSIGLQPIYWALTELARAADPGARAELAEILLGLAGHLFATNFINRWFARQAAQSALVLKAELSAAHVPTMNGYAAAIQGLNNAMMPSAGFEDSMTPTALHLAQFLPSRIHRAFAAADPSMLNSRFFGELNVNPPESERAALETAKANVTQAARKLIEAALSDPDGILGAYLRGLPSSTASGNLPWASFSTPVGDLMHQRQDLFRAAAANEEAMNGIVKLWQNDPSVKNVERMMKIAWALQTYAQNHGSTYPESIAALVESGELKPPVATESLLTGRPFIYVAAGEKSPAKTNDRAMFVLLYDDEPDQYGCYPCVFAACAGSHIRPDDLREQLQRRGK